MPERMRAAVLDEPGSIQLHERSVPAIGVDDVLVRVREVGICGSDVHYFRHGRIGRYVVEQPIILGHEPAGEIVDVGANIPRTRLGERVAIEPGVPCRRCKYCKTGRYNLCPFVVFMATPPVDGALAEYVAVPFDFAHPVPQSMSIEEAALIEPTAVAVHAARLARAAPGLTCAVFGAGPVGLLLCQVLKAFSVSHVTVFDPLPERRAQALVLSADAAFEPGTAKRSGVEPRDFDIALDASGSASAIAATVRVARRGGRVVWIGLPRSDEIPIPAATLIDKELELHGVFRYANAHPLAIELVASGRVKVRPLITHRFRLEHAAEAFETVEQQRDGVIKALITP